MRPKYFFFPALLALTLLSCHNKEEILDKFFREPDLTPVRKVLKAAMPLGYAANMAVSALNGASLSNVHVISHSPDSLGGFLVYVDVDGSFPLPQGVSAGGSVAVAGMTAKHETYIMTALFADMNITAGTFTVRNVSSFPAVWDSVKKRLMVVYADVDVNAGPDTVAELSLTGAEITAELTKLETMMSFDSGVVLDENAWCIAVDGNGTPDNAADDRYTVIGGGQYVEAGESGASLVQLTMIGAAMTPACRLNPSGGWALFQDMGVSQGATGSSVEAGHVFLTFHAACDGRVQVVVATGTYTISTGSTMVLGLDQ